MPTHLPLALLSLCTIAIGVSSLAPTVRAADTHGATTSEASVKRLDFDRNRALEPGTGGSTAIARVLADYHHRGDGEGGFAWWMKLPIAVRSRQANQTDARRWRNRIEFLRDAQRDDAVSCAISGRPVLEDALGCDYATELRRYLACTAKLPDARRAELVGPLRTGAQTRLDEQVARCPQDADAIVAAREALMAP